MPISAADPLLRIAGLSSGYGKTTLLRAVSGLLPWSGGVQFDGRDLSGSGPRETAKAGLAHVIEGHRVFTQQSVLDNLRLAAYDLPRGERAARVEEAFGFFPEIAETGTAVLLVEQLIEKALALADRVYALARGAIVLEAKTDEVDLPRRLEHAYFAIATRQDVPKSA